MKKTLKILTLCLMLTMYAIPCLAMRFSAPVEVGNVSWAQNWGGFVVRNARKNEAVVWPRPEGVRSDVEHYKEGIAKFEEWGNPIYAHYSADEPGQVYWGSEDKQNTIAASSLLDCEIIKIDTDGRRPFFAARNSSTFGWDFIIFYEDESGAYRQVLDTHGLLDSIGKEYKAAHPDNPAVFALEKDLTAKGDTLLGVCRRFDAANYQKGVPAYKCLFKWNEEKQAFDTEITDVAS